MAVRPGCCRKGEFLMAVACLTQASVGSGVSGPLATPWDQ